MNNKNEIRDIIYQIEHLTNDINNLIDTKKELQEKILSIYRDNIDLGTTKTIDIQNYKITIKRPVTYSIDNNILKTLDIENKPVRYKAELDKKKYDLLDSETKYKFDDCLTMKIGSESLTIKNIEE